MAGAPTKDIDLSQIMEEAMNLEPTALVDWLIVMPVAFCIVMGACLLMVRKHVEYQHILSIPAMAILVLINAMLLWQVMEHGTQTMVMGRWLPPFGIAFTVDILSAMLTFVSGLVAFACVLYGVKDVDKSGRRYGFFPFLFLLMAGVNGAFLTGDIFNLYVWFEVLLIASFGLLVLGSEKGQLDGATKYAFLNLVATTLFLIATGYLYGIFGTLNMADIAMQSGGKREAPLMTLTILYFLAFAMKAAAFPVNFWLPASYHTPRIVISALFAGLLTKVGVYALFRVLVMMFPLEYDQLLPLIGAVACLTMILGAVGALGQTDIRRILGFLVVSGIGMMMIGIAVSSQSALGGAIFYALHSILVMTALYIAYGLASRISGGASGLLDMRGIFQKDVFLAAMTLILLLAVAGLPPFSGFWPKLMLVEATISGGPWWSTAAVLLSGFLTMIAVGRIWILCYWQPVDADEEAEAGERLSMADYAPLVGLTLIIVLVGLSPQTVFEQVYSAAGQLIDSNNYINSVFGVEASLSEVAE